MAQPDMSTPPPPPPGFELDSEHYGTLGQQSLAGLEGIGKGLLGPVAPALEEATGLTTGADIRARAEANPITHGASEVGGFVLPAILSGGATAEAKAGLGALSLPSLIGKVGEGAEAAAGAAGITSKLAIGGLKGGAELAALQGSDELYKTVTGDPNQSLQTAAINIGLSGILGAPFGAALGAVSPLWKATAEGDTGKMLDAAKANLTGIGPDEKTVLESMQELKPNAGDIQAAADRLGAPILESQISASKAIQDFDSLLLNSGTIPALARRNTLQRGINIAEQAVDTSLGDVENMSKVGLGSALKDSLTAKVESAQQPINALYDSIKQSTQNVPVSDNAKRAIIANLKDIDGYNIVGSSVRSLIDNAIENIKTFDSVDAVKNYRSYVNRELGLGANGNQKYVIGEIAQKLSNLEENSIVRAGESLAKEARDPAVRTATQQLLEQRQQANSFYKTFKDSTRGITDILFGKNKNYGPQGLIDALDNLPEEKFVNLFSKDNFGALNKFGKSFPDEMKLLVDYQKGAIRSAATKDGVLDVNKVMRSLDKFGPEVKGLMFSPEELQKLSDVRTYMESIPKNINPSGTSKAEALRRFITNPASSTVQTVGDYGLGKFISAMVPKGTLEKTVSAAQHDALFKSMFPAIEENVIKKETNPSSFKASVDYMMSVAKGQRDLGRAVDGIFKPGAEVLGKNSMPDAESRKRLQEEIAAFPQNAQNIGGHLGHYMPDHATAAAQTAATAVNFLNSIKPAEPKLAPLDKKMPPDKKAQETYNQALEVAEQPLMALHHVKQGTLTPIQVQTLHTIYPDLHAAIIPRLTEGLIESQAKGNDLKYSQRQALNLLIGGTPLETSMSPMGMQAIIQSSATQQANRMAQQGKHKASSTELSQINKVNSLYQTPIEARESGRRA
jgi:hypothetical protein